MQALSLFSGAGGMDLGIRQAGFSVLAAIESDPHCIATLQAAVEREALLTRIIHVDISTLDPAVLQADLGLAVGSLDLLFCGPPCQAFSLAGKRGGLLDGRGPLLFEMIRFAEVFRPKAILVEQVKGLLSAKGISGQRGEVFADFLRQLQALGYSTEWQVLMAADFGVPQLRERVFVVATLGQKAFEFPTPTHTKLADNTTSQGLLPYVGIGEVMGGLGAPSLKQRGQKAFPGQNSHVDVTPARDRGRIAQVPEGSYLAAQTQLSEDLRKGLSAKDTTKYLRLHRARPANTLRCGEIFYHPSEPRYLTPRECLRIHGYPDTYQLLGPIRARSGNARNLDQHRQVANSVPPPLAKLLGEKIARHLQG